MGLAGVGALLLLAALPGLCEEFTATVVGITRGDIFEIERDGQRQAVHLFGIVCPDTTESCGRYAEGFARRLVLDKEVRCSVKGETESGQTVVDVIRGSGNTLSALLLKAGLARCDETGASDPALKEREDSARTARKGLWREPSDGGAGPSVPNEDDNRPPPGRGMGRVSCDLRDFWTIVTLEDDGSLEGRIELNDRRRTVTVPTGRYVMRRWGFMRRDATGATWELVGGGTHKGPVVYPNETAEVRFGPPFTAKVEAYNHRAKDGTPYVAVAVSNLGVAGEHYHTLKRNGKRPTAPLVEIFRAGGDAAARGARVSTGTMNYG